MVVTHKLPNSHTHTINRQRIAAAASPPLAHTLARTTSMTSRQQCAGFSLALAAIRHPSARRLGNRPVAPDNVCGETPASGRASFHRELSSSEQTHRYSYRGRLRDPADDDDESEARKLAVFFWRAAACAQQHATIESLRRRRSLVYVCFYIRPSRVYDEKCSRGNGTRTLRQQQLAYTHTAARCSLARAFNYNFRVCLFIALAHTGKTFSLFLRCEPTRFIDDH
jgi:hypothetical protein